MNPFLIFIKDQLKWSRKTFGDGLRTESILRHIEKEVQEIRAEPNDLEEWIDVVLLGLDGAWRCARNGIGQTDDEICSDVAFCLLEKQRKNRKRKWPKPTDETTPTEHVREGHGRKLSRFEYKCSCSPVSDYAFIALVDGEWSLVCQHCEEPYRTLRDEELEGHGLVNEVFEPHVVRSTTSFGSLANISMGRITPVHDSVLTPGGELPVPKIPEGWETCFFEDCEKVVLPCGDVELVSPREINAMTFYSGGAKIPVSEFIRYGIRAIRPIKKAPVVPTQLPVDNIANVGEFADKAGHKPARVVFLPEEFADADKVLISIEVPK